MNHLPRDAEILVARLAEARGISPDEAIIAALKETLDRVEPQAPPTPRLEGEALIRRGKEISARYRALPLLDSRSADEILGYDEFGLPT